MKKALLTAIICTFAALQSCSSGKRSFATDMKGTETTNSTTEYTAVIREIADKGEFWNTLFTLVNIGSEKENVCISPLSAQLALSMTAAGATGETQKQLLFNMATVALGELVVCYALGLPMIYGLKKLPAKLFE